MRAAKQVIHGMQEQLVATVCGSDTWDLRNAGLDELREHLDFKGIEAKHAEELCQQLHLGQAWCSRAPEPVMVAPPAAAPVLAEDDADIGDECAPFFITVVGKKRLRRLHRAGSCGVSSMDVYESEPVWQLKGAEFDLACQHCWKAGEATLSEAEEADDSGSSGAASEDNAGD